MQLHTELRRATVVGAIVLVAVVAVAACSGDDDGGASPTAETFETVEVTEPLFSRTSDDGAAPVTTVGATEVPPVETEVATTATPSTGADLATTLPTVPETGVPGIDSDDLFCRSWSEFTGSFQALAGAWALGEQLAAARLEVAASAALLTAATQLDANVPAEVETERAALTELTEPMSRRAQAARDEMLAAGLADDAMDALGAAWLDALAESGVDDPDLSVAVPAGVDEAAFTQAVQAFAAARPSIVEDPSLITDAVVPQYLIDNCPDQGTLAGNDVIEG
jgi:hypothetical protein